MDKLTITRTNQYANRLRKIKLFLDGSELYRISNNETKTFEIPDGEHQLYAKVDWYTSRPITLTIEPGQENKLEVGSPAKDTSLRKGFSSISFLFSWGSIFLSKYLHNDLICIIPCTILVLVSIYIYFIAKPKSPLYYMFIAWRDYLYLKAI